jgi:lambda family phage portal protein
MSAPVIYDASGRPVPLSKARRKAKGQAKEFFSGFKGANDETLFDWAALPLDIKTILRNDLAKLRARSRDLARNDDTARRFLSLIKQNVLGHAGIILQAKNKLKGGKKPDVKWNEEIEKEWIFFGKKRRRRGAFESPSACGQMSLREIAWLTLLTRAIDGECFLQILHGYPHNRHRFAVRFLNADLLDSTYSEKISNGNTVDMGIEFDEFSRPVAYHFSEGTTYTDQKNRRPIPASQIIHIFRKEYVGQIRGIPDFAGIMHKAKMLNGVHEAIVIGWRVAAAKMGFFTADPDLMYGEDEDGEEQTFKGAEIEATPGSFEVIPQGYDLKTFDPDYPTSTYESGHRVFMQQLSNGLNVSSPTLSNDYSRVNYSSLRQALIEDREGWRCIQAEMIDSFYQPLFDEWYDFSTDITMTIKLAATKKNIEPAIVWQPRGWPWVDPLKEVKAQIAAVTANFRTRQSVIAETSGADFTETADGLRDECEILKDRGLNANIMSDLLVETETNQNEDNSND